MSPQQDPGTTSVVQQILGELVQARDPATAAPVIRVLLTRSIDRLHSFCASILRHSYPRLTNPPLNLNPDELLSSVVERLLKALESVHPQNVRQFFALANQHIRWELNDIARRLDKSENCVGIIDGMAVAPQSSGSELSLSARRMLDAIDNLPEIEREVFSLIRIQGMAQGEVAEIMGLSLRTVQRRLHSSMVLLSESLSDLDPGIRFPDDV